MVEVWNESHIVCESF